MRRYYPDKRALYVLRILILSIGLLLAIALRLIVDGYNLRVILGIFIALTVNITVFVYLPMLFNSLSFAAGEYEIQKAGGVFFRRFRSVKCSAIHYVTYINTPVSKYTGLNFIIFHLYGGKLIIPFLAKEDAERIISKLEALYWEE